MKRSPLFMCGTSILNNEKRGACLLDRQNLINAWLQEEAFARSFTGWDFTYLNNRMIEEQPPWDYMALAANLMQSAHALLDMGTGGGERLLQLRPLWPKKVVATEDYSPNLALARQRLEPHGIQIYPVELTRTASMPFENDEFDLVINRHSGLNCHEVARILSTGGTFLTQQIHGLWAQDLLAFFGAKPQWPDSTPDMYIACLQNAGLTITQHDKWQGKLQFRDIGALVFYLHAVPWLVPDFSVEKHLETLFTLQKQLEHDEILTYEARKYMILADKSIQ